MQMIAVLKRIVSIAHVSHVSDRQPYASALMSMIHIGVKAIF